MVTRLRGCAKQVHSSNGLRKQKFSFSYHFAGNDEVVSSGESRAQFESAFRMRLIASDCYTSLLYLCSWYCRCVDHSHSSIRACICSTSSTRNRRHARTSSTFRDSSKVQHLNVNLRDRVVLHLDFSLATFRGWGFAEAAGGFHSWLFRPPGRE